MYLSLVVMSCCLSARYDQVVIRRVSQCAAFGSAVNAYELGMSPDELVSLMVQDGMLIGHSNGPGYLDSENLRRLRAVLGGLSSCSSVALRGESGTAGGLLGGASDDTIVSPSPSASDTRPRTHMFSRRIVVDNVTQGMSNPLLVFIEAPEKER